ncbi:MAG: T9SS type A sorting domain-containing protein [Leptolyngbya sp. SIO3F4]|nr:T9SS type A sorting domain-containing protein [Leptolyngbya sp. SIO3F4]
MKPWYNLVLLFFFGHSLDAQVHCTNDIPSLVISTGVDPITNNLVPESGLDPMWRLVQAPPDPPGWVSNIGGPAIVIPTFSSWDLADPHSRYLNAYSTNRAITDNWDLSTVPYIFERQFCLCMANDASPVSVTFDLALYADNWAKVVLEDALGNQTMLISQPYLYTTANFLRTPHTTNVTLSLLPGMYTLKLYLRNKEVVMGVNLAGTIYSDALIADKHCTGKGSLAGFLFDDVNGNNQLDPDDARMEGVPVILATEEGEQLAMIASDDAGYYFFMDLEPGTYRLRIPRLDTNQVIPDQYVTVEGAALDYVNFEMGAFDPQWPALPQNTLNIYPNPGNGTFNIEFTGDHGSTATVLVLDQLGRPVGSTETISSGEPWQVNGMAPGLYFVRVTTALGTTVQRVVVQ